MFVVHFCNKIQLKRSAIAMRPVIREIVSNKFIPFHYWNKNNIVRTSVSLVPPLEGPLKTTKGTQLSMTSYHHLNRYGHSKHSAYSVQLLRHLQFDTQYGKVHVKRWVYFNTMHGMFGQCSLNDYLIHSCGTNVKIMLSVKSLLYIYTMYTRQCLQNIL